jgi:hypothetical protein
LAAILAPGAHGKTCQGQTGGERAEGGVRELLPGKLWGVIAPHPPKRKLWAAGIVLSFI